MNRRHVDVLSFFSLPLKEKRSSVLSSSCYVRGLHTHPKEIFFVPELFSFLDKNLCMKEKFLCNITNKYISGYLCALCFM